VPEVYRLAMEVRDEIRFNQLLRVVDQHAVVQLSAYGYLIYPIDMEAAQWIASTLSRLGHTAQFVWKESMEGRQ